MTAHDEGMGASRFLSATGATYRQVDCWARAGLFETAGSPGSGRRRRWTDEDVRRALIARDVSALTSENGAGGIAGLVPLVLAIVRLADTVDAPFVAITPDRNLHALHDVAEAGDQHGSAVLVVSARPDVEAHLAAAS